MAELDYSQLRAAVGANADYYEKRFSRIALGGRRWVPGWNSAAFWHSTGWFCYRRMYAFAFLNFFAPWVLVFALGYAGDWMAPGGNRAEVVTILLATYVGCVFVLVPLFADSLYYRHLVARLPAARPPSVWTALGATALGLFYFGLPLAQLSTYADYTPRARASEVLLHMGALKAQVTEFAGSNGRLPANMHELAQPPALSKYVKSMDLQADATIVATLQGVKEFEGKMILLRPLLKGGNVTWVCGTPDENFFKHLPAECWKTLHPDRASN